MLFVDYDLIHYADVFINTDQYKTRPLICFILVTISVQHKNKQSVTRANHKVCKTGWVTNRSALYTAINII